LIAALLLRSGRRWRAAPDEGAKRSELLLPFPEAIGNTKPVPKRSASGTGHHKINTATRCVVDAFHKCAMVRRVDGNFHRLLTQVEHSAA
jgi:hypothetical protein